MVSYNKPYWISNCARFFKKNKQSVQKIPVLQPSSYHYIIPFFTHPSEQFHGLHIKINQFVLILNDSIPIALLHLFHFNTSSSQHYLTTNHKEP